MKTLIIIVIVAVILAFVLLFELAFLSGTKEKQDEK